MMEVEFGGGAHNRKSGGEPPHSKKGEKRDKSCGQGAQESCAPTKTTNTGTDLKVGRYKPDRKAPA